jgi:hypothetical protein
MQETEGLFNNLTYERVRLNLSRPIGDGQPGLDGRGEERGAATGVGGGRGGSAIAGDLKLAGVVQTDATVHGFQN